MDLLNICAGISISDKLEVQSQYVIFSLGADSLKWSVTGLTAGWQVDYTRCTGVKDISEGCGGHMFHTKIASSIFI